MTLISLVYISFAKHPMSESELRALLEECRTNNEKLNVTGMLLYRNGFFIQALEGDEEVVEKLYAEILKDPRHQDILRVYKAPIMVRSFPNWTMGFNQISDQHRLDMEGYSDFLARPSAEYFAQQPSRAQILLESFRNETFF
ncbi:MAG: BLUF domain-containing protein [Chloroflexi bacterium CFX4]|nr:BLUF domain-containing protein [Chloroflexi bacterium CFX4]MDL1922520.1 BLUF domain-containing protein [Chloroflexi bacterium CFX3]